MDKEVRVTEEQIAELEAYAEGLTHQELLAEYLATAREYIQVKSELEELQETLHSAEVKLERLAGFGSAMPGTKLQ